MPQLQYFACEVVLKRCVILTYAINTTKVRIEVLKKEKQLEEVKEKVESS